MKRIIFIIITALILSSCGQSGGTIEDKSSENLTTVGNPNPTIPLSTYLTKNTYWKGSTLFKGLQFENVYMAKFDVEKGAVTIKQVGVEKEYSVPVIISDDNGTVASEDNEYNIQISGKYMPEEKGYPMEMSFSFKDSEKSQMYLAEFEASSVFDENPDPVVMCKKSSQKFSSSTMDLAGNGTYYVSEDFVTRGNDGSECSLMIRSYCEVEGKLLAKPIYYANTPNGLPYGVEMVECNCQKGKCVGDIRKESLKVDVKFFDMCNAASLNLGIPHCANFSGLAESIFNAKISNLETPRSFFIWLKKHGLKIEDFPNL